MIFGPVGILSLLSAFFDDTCAPGQCRIVGQHQPGNFLRLTSDTQSLAGQRAIANPSATSYFRTSTFGMEVVTVIEGPGIR
jgi:hypothetical protein